MEQPLNCFEKWCGLLIVAGMTIVMSGCASSGTGQYGNGYSYTPRSTYSSPSSGYNTYSTRSNTSTVQSRPQQVIVEKTYSFSDPNQTGASFQSNYRQSQALDRERKINAFLRSEGMLGDVIETRDKFKIAIRSADEKLRQLRREIAISGNAATADSRYLALKANRDRLEAKLQSLDDRIMNAIVNKTTGEVARHLIWRAEDREAANAATGNLQNVEQQYERRANDLLRQSNW